MRRVYFYEVSVSKLGNQPSRVNRFNLADKCQWVRKGESRDTHFEAMQDAIANGERPYRIKTELIHEAVVVA